MRLRLLMASLVDSVLQSLNMATRNRVTTDEDARRVALIGDDASIHEQTLRARVFSEEIAATRAQITEG